MAGYGTDGGFSAWLTENGYSLSTDAPDVSVLRQRGSAYIDGLYGSQFSDRRYSGVPTGGYIQERAWPRTGAMAHGQAIPDDAIPDAVVKASYFAAYQEASDSGSPEVTETAGETIKSITADTARVEYRDPGSADIENAIPVMSQINGLLAPLLVWAVPDKPVGIWSI
jgi:hypothetical protein